MVPYEVSVNGELILYLKDLISLNIHQTKNCSGQNLRIVKRKKKEDFGAAVAQSV
jgi:hypothetical protein